MPGPTLTDAVVYVLMMFAAVLLAISAISVFVNGISWTWRRLRPSRRAAKVLPLVRKDRTYPRPKGAV